MAILAGVQRDTCPWNSGPFWNALVACQVAETIWRRAWKMKSVLAAGQPCRRLSIKRWKISSNIASAFISNNFPTYRRFAHPPIGATQLITKT